MNSMLARVVGVALLTATACSSETADDPRPTPYGGVSERLPTGSSEISEDGLVAAYDMVSTMSDGAVRDFGPLGLHGLGELGETADGPVGRARLFTSVDDRLDLPEDPAFDLDGPLTVAAWVRIDSTGIHQHIAACDDKWALWVTPANQYRLGDTHGGGWSSAPGSVEAGRWVPVVAVLRGSRGDPLESSTASLYVGGSLTDAGAHLRNAEARAARAWRPGDLYPDDACHLAFESHQGVESHKSLPFVGAIDQLLIFGRAWTDAEVRAFSTRPD